MFALSLIIIGILLRFVPHAPNFTPVAAIALFSGAYLNKRLSLAVPLLLMVASDIFIGFHNVIPFTWGSFILIALLGGRYLKQHKGVLATASMSIASSVLFFVISNFGVWAMGWYPHTLKGLLDCYIMALPFLRDFTVATLVYAFGFFAAFELVARFARSRKLSEALLTI